MSLREIVGRRFLRKGQELYCSYVESGPDGPEVHWALNFTKNYKRTKALTAPQNWGPGSIQWENTCNNLGAMGRTLSDLPPKKVVYCVGSGPALKRNWRELEKVKGRSDSIIIGCNELLQYLPSGLLDYYTALDARSPDRWWEGFDCSETTAIFGPFIPPRFREANWRDVMWYRIGYHNKLNAMVASKRGGLEVINPLYGAGPSELEIAWRFKPEVIVLVGHSYAYDMVDGVIYEHFEEPLEENRWEGVLRSINSYTTDDIYGKQVVTDYHILITAMMTLTCCQMLQDAGVRVINATEGGILRSNPVIPAYKNRARFPELGTLAETVEMLK